MKTLSFMNAAGFDHDWNDTMHPTGIDIEKEKKRWIEFWGDKRE